MSQIQFVYFDVGGVAIVDFSGNNKWEEMKRSFGVDEKNERDFDALWNKYEESLCIDRDVDSLIPEFKKIHGIRMSEDYSMLADFVDRFERNEFLWSVFENVKKQYRIGLLTNMYPRMLDAIMGKGLLPDRKWDVIVDSSVVGYQKPHPAIFQIAEEQSGAQPDEILFIDNSAQHIKEASRRGWKTFLYDSKDVRGSTQELIEVLNLNTKEATMP